MEKMLSFGAVVKQRRKAMDLTQEHLSRLVGCSQDLIKKIESGVRQPSLQIARRLAQFLQVPDDELADFLSLARPDIQPSYLTERPAPVAAPAPALPALPRHATPTVGREADAAAVIRLLEQPGIRLLTLIGPGGIGKTRLSLQVAGELEEHFPDGVVFVPLASLADPGRVMPAIAQSLGLAEHQTAPPAEVVASALANKTMLLVLDNFEHVLSAAPSVGRLLDQLPELKVMTTSRAPLRVYREQSFMVPPLPLPDLHHPPSSTEIARYPAVELFYQRARAAGVNLPLTPDTILTVSQICQRLDGLPLAIELAAVRTRVLPPHAMLARLDHSLSLLTSGARDLPLRQQTMRAAIEWSYTLLNAEEQRLFRRLGAFYGGWTLAAAEAVCAQADGLDILVGIEGLLDQSLCQEGQSIDDEPHFVMLETIREYAMEQLESSGELERIRESHARYYLSLVEQVEPKLTGFEQRHWLDLLQQEHQNLRAALQWFIDHEGGALSLRFIGAVWKFWQFYGHKHEGRQWMERALALPIEQSSEEAQLARAKVLWGAGWLVNDQGDVAQSGRLFEESLEISRRLEDARGIGLALHGVGHVAVVQRDLARAWACGEESLAIFRALADTEEIAWSLRHLGIVATLQKNHSLAAELHEESLSYFQAVGHTWGIAWQLIEIGQVFLSQGLNRQATMWLEDSLVYARGLGDQRHIARSLHLLGLSQVGQQENELAYQRLAESLALFREVQDPEYTRSSLGHLARAALFMGNVAEAEAALSEAISLARKAEDDSLIAFVLAPLGVDARALGHTDLARRGYAEGLLLVRRCGYRSPDLAAICILGVITTRLPPEPAPAEAERAARLLGFVDQAANMGSWQPHEIESYECVVASCRAALPAETFERLWQEGRQLAPDDATHDGLAYAGHLFSY